MSAADSPLQDADIPERQIRAVYDEATIRVYQAYSDSIADSALDHGTFISPPFNMSRMTWIKPSFLWMMYRAGWGLKHASQARILAIDITHEGFAWALAHSCPSFPGALGMKEWQRLKANAPVRIQWDPERDLFLQPLAHRAIQIGLTEQAVERYVHQWIRRITDVTELATSIRALVVRRRLEEAHEALPIEKPYAAQIPEY